MSFTTFMKIDDRWACDLNQSWHCNVDFELNVHKWEQIHHSEEMWFI